MYRIEPAVGPETHAGKASASLPSNAAPSTLPRQASLPHLAEADAAAGPVQCSHLPEDRSRSGRPNRHSDLARKAMDHVRQLAGRPAYLLDLARAAGVSERTLEKAFAVTYGTSPLRYIRQWRLQQARQILQQSRPGQTLVKAVALEHGFRDLGRFSAYYREMFGETPSETLRNGVNGGEFMERLRTA